jgi:hypothetical protein
MLFVCGAGCTIWIAGLRRKGVEMRKERVLLYGLFYVVVCSVSCVAMWLFWTYVLRYAIGV